MIARHRASRRRAPRRHCIFLQARRRFATAIGNCPAFAPQQRC
ncbi:hypothetical protein GLE_5452 [Lysobacter enzymogenes]|uniref:Uncharacterized protein n=1 Tax=Lysobacter enzymogenes TaxID=69 RepID=A0A0S2DQT0_LYSEN|nr:hypothetical protein GLE_5452 [Lysobacter enzymogenes]